MKRTMIVMGSALLMLFVFTLIYIPDKLAAAEKESKKKGYLGVSVEELSRHQKKDLKAEFGVVITNIDEDSPADKDGLMEDDVIQQVNDVKITRSSTLTRVIRKMAPGDKAKIAIIRDGKEKTITVTIGRLKSGSYSLSVGPGKNLFSWYGGGGRAYLGVQLHELNKDLAAYFGAKEAEGALILEVEEDSPAEKAGLKSGDVITKIDNETMANPEDVQEMIAELEEDDEVKIEILRQNKKQTISVKLEERDSKDVFIGGPQRMIRELKLKQNPEKSFQLILPEINKDQKHREIIIEKKKAIQSNTI